MVISVFGACVSHMLCENDKPGSIIWPHPIHTINKPCQKHNGKVTKISSKFSVNKCFSAPDKMPFSLHFFKGQTLHHELTWSQGSLRPALAHNVQPPRAKPSRLLTIKVSGQPFPPSNTSMCQIISHMCKRCPI